MLVGGCELTEPDDKELAETREFLERAVELEP